MLSVTKAFHNVVPYMGIYTKLHLMGPPFIIIRFYYGTFAQFSLLILFVRNDKEALLIITLGVLCKWFKMVFYRKSDSNNATNIRQRVWPLLSYQQALNSIMFTQSTHHKCFIGKQENILLKP